MFSTDQHLQKLERARRQFVPGNDFLLDRVVEDMVERLGAVQRTFDHGIALLSRTGRLADLMKASGQVTKVTRIEEAVSLDSAEQTVPSVDTLELDESSADLIIAPLALHWANDLPGAFIQINRALKPDGLLLATLPGPDTLLELRSSLLRAESEVTGGAGRRIDPFTDVRDAGGLLQRAGFALPVADQDPILVRYDRIGKIVRDLRGFGATRQTSDVPVSMNRTIMRRAEEIYADEFSDPDGRLRATFQIVSLSGWRAHPAQQKPLKPGSATHSLAEVLKTSEKKA